MYHMTKYILLLLLFILLFAGCSRIIHSTGIYNDVNRGKNLNNSLQGDVKNELIIDSRAMHRATMRPYVVLGHKYYPKSVKIGDEFTGVASWYGPNFHSKKTSNGEVYNMHAHTAAHTTFPMNTIVQVENTKNQKSTVVRINDRGPFVKNRIIDLSSAAAHEIDMVNDGTANVKLIVLNLSENQLKQNIKNREELGTNQYNLQIGAFSKLKSAQLRQRKFQNTINSKYNVIIKEYNYSNNIIYRVLINGFEQREEAYNFKQQNGLDTAVIVVY